MSVQTTVAIVDDNEGVLRALQLTIKTLGLPTTVYSSPQRALEELPFLEKPPLVLTDLRMPLISGEELALGIKQLRPEIPIILMSGHAVSAELQRLIPKVIVGFLPKPFTPPQFLELALPWL